MDEALPMEPATTATGPLPGLPGLVLEEFLQCGVWKISTGSASLFSQFADPLVGSTPGIGEMVATDHLRLVRYGPEAAYLLFDARNTPTLPSGWGEQVTDISHGLCELRLNGDNARCFIADYISVDLDSRLLRKSRTVRTRIGQFKVLLWWSGASDIHILVDRSLAQSFNYYLRALAARWSKCPTDQLFNHEI